MDEETLNFYTRHIEREQAERVQAGLKRADSGHLIDHSRLKAMAAGWCKIEESKLNEVVVISYRDARINWSDTAVFDLQRTCEHLTTVWALHDRTPDIAESHLKNVPTWPCERNQGMGIGFRSADDCVPPTLRRNSGAGRARLASQVAADEIRARVVGGQKERFVKTTPNRRLADIKAYAGFH